VPYPYAFFADGWEITKSGGALDHLPRRITLSLEKLCPVHRGFIAMSGWVMDERVGDG
jgi:hypothetical protein